MPYITVGKENSSEIKIHYEDRGKGKPVVLIHGFPFSGAAWEKQERTFLNEGFRVITYDRRGFGQSSQPSTGYDTETFAKDLDKLLNFLDLYEIVLIGHSMGTGEIARYLRNYDSDRISRIVLISPILPYLLKTSDNQSGLDLSVFEEIKESILKDRFSFLTQFIKKFYNAEESRHHLVSEDKLHHDFNIASFASPLATIKCVDTWYTDFRTDIKKIDIPCLVIQGDKDKIIPLEASGAILERITSARLVIIPDGPHGIPWTHSDIINQEILHFIKEKGTTKPLSKIVDQTKDSRLH